MRTTERLFVCARGRCGERARIHERVQKASQRGTRNLLGLSIRRIPEMGTVWQVHRNRLVRGRVEEK